jgi:hypothetical protein
MFSLWKGPAKLLGGLLLTGLISPLLAANTPVPGAVNYIEGQVSINGDQLSSKSVGSAEVDRNQVITTDQGKVELLLTPGVFLRLGDNSSLRMVSPSLTDTQVELQRGEAMLEVDQLYRENSIRLLEDGASAQILKKGVYEFNADQQRVAVYDGQAQVAKEDQSLKLKKGKQTKLGERLRATKFDRSYEDPLYAWSSLRSQYVAEGSAQYASAIYVNSGPWWGPGWYWNPYWSMYGFIPGAGILYSPFGWGFYSPWAIGPYYAWYGGARLYGRPVRGLPRASQKPGLRNVPAPRPHVGGPSPAPPSGGVAPAPRTGGFAPAPRAGAFGATPRTSFSGMGRHG